MGMAIWRIYVYRLQNTNEVMHKRWQREDDVAALINDHCIHSLSILNVFMLDMSLISI